ncbi:hypothetical protein PWP93_02320 [Paraburkholderia sp. A1RI-2L]|uniref:helix-turn-helix transcriptional regulator n=1 Tax=Paraburkholderia sp. A1RI-2L TaxID=3028367 RepID=UPI003B819E2C
MEVVHLNQKQLAARWGVAEATLERWRSEGDGPKYLKLRGRVAYRLVDVESFEESCLMTPTPNKAKTPAPGTSAGQPLPVRKVEAAAPSGHVPRWYKVVRAQD